MSEIPQDLKYTKDHEWIQLADDGTALIGITDYAQESLGDVTFVELPEVGDSFESGDTFGVVESVKAASDLYMPVSGEIVEINDALEGEPELVNRSPYKEAWLIKVQLADDANTDDLLSADSYREIAG
ncbi:MAG: glycine cleavage system protein GcvH [Opitutales bacterium]|nr:glycine cleavage system protein GcvH [Opitutales bacterium]